MALSTWTSNIPNYGQRLNPFRQDKDSKISIVLGIFALKLRQQNLASWEVVLKWRDVGEEALRANFMTFGEWCEIDKGFEDYIKALFPDEHETDFVAEVITQKNMDIRNGETL